MIIGVISCESENQQHIIVQKTSHDGILEITIAGETASISLMELSEILSVLLDKKSMKYFLKCIDVYVH